MKKVFWIIQVSFAVIILFLATDCKKEEIAKITIPLLSTSSITDVTATTATSGGDITSDGGAAITDRGVCWITTKKDRAGNLVKPSISDSKTVDEDGTGQFVSNISGLTAGTSYQVRAYATNSTGTTYGGVLSFSTLGQ